MLWELLLLITSSSLTLCRRYIVPNVWIVHGLFIDINTMYGLFIDMNIMYGLFIDINIMYELFIDINVL